MESVVFAAGGVYASPVPTYNAPRFGSMVGEFHTPPPEGANCCVPLAFFVVALGASGMM
jgi:hypothetical protein